MSTFQVRTPQMSTWRLWWMKHQAQSTLLCFSPCLERSWMEPILRMWSAMLLPALTKRELVSLKWTRENEHIKLWLHIETHHSWSIPSYQKPAKNSIAIRIVVYFRRVGMKMVLFHRGDPGGVPAGAAHHDGRQVYRRRSGRALQRSAHRQEREL